ncbi:hypothetical protein C8R45DRAFT_931797 [Mycena sanguinolenta]|nr:hypothetical protein C8R45DRAFT_931797 [Mycena sanguinolenta]
MTRLYQEGLLCLKLEWCFTIALKAKVEPGQIAPVENSVKLAKYVIRSSVNERRVAEKRVAHLNKPQESTFFTYLQVLPNMREESQLIDRGATTEMWTPSYVLQDIVEVSEGTAGQSLEAVNMFYIGTEAASGVILQQLDPPRGNGPMTIGVECGCKRNPEIPKIHDSEEILRYHVACPMLQSANRQNRGRRMQDAVWRRGCAEGPAHERIAQARSRVAAGIKMSTPQRKVAESRVEYGNVQLDNTAAVETPRKSKERIEKNRAQANCDNRDAPLKLRYRLELDRRNASKEPPPRVEELSKSQVYGEPIERCRQEVQVFNVVCPARSVVAQRKPHRTNPGHIKTPPPSPLRHIPSHHRAAKKMWGIGSFLLSFFPTTHADAPEEKPAEDSKQESAEARGFVLSLGLTAFSPGTPQGGVSAILHSPAAPSVDALVKNESARYNLALVDPYSASASSANYRTFPGPKASASEVDPISSLQSDDHDSQNPRFISSGGEKPGRHTRPIKAVSRRECTESPFLALVQIVDKLFYTHAFSICPLLRFTGDAVIVGGPFYFMGSEDELVQFIIE